MPVVLADVCGAAEGGHLSVLQWAREHGCPWDEWTCNLKGAPGGVGVGAGAPLPVGLHHEYSAASGGHLAVLQWAPTSCVLIFPDRKMPCWSVMAGKHCSRGLRCNYSHDATSLTQLVDVIHSAKQTLDVCVFNITCNELAFAVIDAKRRGVAVRVISDAVQAKSSGSRVARIAGQGIEVRTNAAAGPGRCMHHKFAIIDKRILLIGSFNWTRHVVTANRENVVIQKQTVACASTSGSSLIRCG